MGVYIKGMRMPKGCYEPTVTPSYCFLLRSGTCKICYEYANEHGGELCMEYLQGCPLVEVEEPHGRLIDEDEVRTIIHQVASRERRTYEGTECAVRCMKAVIEAEGE